MGGLEAPALPLPWSGLAPGATPARGGARPAAWALCSGREKPSGGRAASTAASPRREWPGAQTSPLPAVLHPIVGQISFFKSAARDPLCESLTDTDGGPFLGRSGAQTGQRQARLLTWVGDVLSGSFRPFPSSVRQRLCSAQRWGW